MCGSVSKLSILFHCSYSSLRPISHCFFLQLFSNSLNQVVSVLQVCSFSYLFQYLRPSHCTIITLDLIFYLFLFPFSLKNYIQIKSTGYSLHVKLFILLFFFFSSLSFLRVIHAFVCIKSLFIFLAVQLSVVGDITVFLAILQQ